MRHVLAAAVVALGFGCTDRTPPPGAQAPPRREQPLAPDGSTARAITSAPDRVSVQLDLATVRAALRAFREERAAWPRSLDELSFESRLSHPADLAYDPSSGTVTSRTYPSL